MLEDYKGADFVLIDCDGKDPRGVFVAAQKGAEPNRALILGYNALHWGSWQSDEMIQTHFLPIGEGLLVTRTSNTSSASTKDEHCGTGNKRSRWLVKVDKCTGEEHVFRIRDRQWIEA